MIKKFMELLLCKKYVDSIFRDCRAYESFDGKAKFLIDEKLLKALFPERYKEAIERAEREYKEKCKNV